MREIGKAQDRIGKCDADRAESDQRPDDKPVEEICGVTGRLPFRCRRDRARQSSDRSSAPARALVPVAALHQDIGAVGESQRGARVLFDEHDRDAGLRGFRRALRIRSRPASATDPPTARRASAPLGPTSSARAMASICRCPPEAAPRKRAGAQIGESHVHAAIRSARSGLGKIAGRELQIVVDTSAGEDILGLRRESEARGDQAMGRRRAMSRPAVTRPPLIGVSPATALIEGRLAGAVRPEHGDDLAGSTSARRRGRWGVGLVARDHVVARRGAGHARSCRRAAEIGLDDAGIADHGVRRPSQSSLPAAITKTGRTAARSRPCCAR